MANTSSAKKRVRVNDRKTAINRIRKSKIKTAFRKVMKSIESGNIDESKQNLVEFESAIMKGVSKGVYKKNTASRKLRGLAKKIRIADGNNK